MTDNIRVRFAPSPTGALHLGNLRTAVFNWLFSKKMSGSLVLRIEDTDTARSTTEAEEGILSDLAWIGISFDEGPHIGGDYGPYRQSERTSIYDEYLKKLIDGKKAYRCYCTPKELEEERRVKTLQSLMPSYSGRCKNLSKEEEEKFVAEGREPSIRLLIESGNVSFDDLIKGTISYDTDSLGGDFIIQRSNGGFVYNFTVVIDDSLMKISHVIRGEDHLTNTVKQLLLYKSLGFTAPKFAHCPLILGDDKKKLSKRVSEDALHTFMADGIIPDALINYTALLGWSNKDGTEIFKKEELTKRFDLGNVSKSPSTFSYDKLKWVNGEHIKLLDVDTFAAILFDYLKDHPGDIIKDRPPIDLAAVSAEKFSGFTRIIKESLITLKDSAEYIGMFFGSEITPTKEAALALKRDGAVDVVNAFITQLNTVHGLDKQSYQNIINSVKEKLGVKGKDLFMPLRAAVSGSTKGPDLDDLCVFLGAKAVSERAGSIISQIF